MRRRGRGGGGTFRTVSGGARRMDRWDGSFLLDAAVVVVAGLVMLQAWYLPKQGG